MAYNSAFPDFIYERAKLMVRGHAMHQFDSLAVPDVSVIEAMHLFYDPVDFPTMQRMAQLAPHKRKRENARIVMPVDTNGSNYHIDFRFNDTIPYILPDEIAHPVDWENPVVARLRRWAEWRWATAQNWGRVYVAVNWLYNHTSMTPNQFKSVWPQFGRLLTHPRQGVLPPDVAKWVERFHKLSGKPRYELHGYPGEFPGGREGMWLIKDTINRQSLLTPAPERTDDEVTITIYDTQTTGRVLIEGFVDRVKSPFTI